MGGFSLSKLRELATDPRNRGDLAVAGGAVLLADGFFGLENPFDGREKRPGIFGCVLKVLLGGVFLVIGLAVSHSLGPIHGGVTTTGRIVDVSTSHSSDNGTQYAGVIEFTDSAGNSHRFTDQVSSSSQPAVGSVVKVSYDPSNPNDARNLSSPLGWWFPAIFIGVGALAMLGGIFGFFVRLLTLLAGVVLLRAGFAERERVKAGGEAGPLFDPGSLVGKFVTRVGSYVKTKRSAWGDFDPLAALDPDPGAVAHALTVPSPLVAAANSFVAAATTRAGQPAATPAAVAQPAPAPAPGGPAAGWYDDPQGSGELRWWDGARWTSSIAPRTTAGAP